MSDAKPGRNRQGFETRAIHQGYDPAEAKGALNPPIYMTSTYVFDSVADGAEVIAGAQPGYIYGRSHNPTQEVLEARLADLEGAEAGLALASGMGAVGSTMLTLLSAGDRLVAHHTLYTNTHTLVKQALPRFGIEVVLVDFNDPAAVAAAINDRTRLIYFETPANPTVDIIDIEAIVAARGSRDIPIAVDGTFASPAVQRPIEFGCDLVIHSLTKFASGHGDVLAGAVLGDTARIDEIRSHGLRYITGAVVSPMTAYLILRGLKTLPIRMRQHAENALILARLLESHPKVAWVRYPGLESHPGHDIARRQMSNGGAMMSFGLKDGLAGATRMLDGLELISRAVSLGDAESLMISPASLIRGRATVHPDEQPALGVTDDLIRFSIGLETVEDLEADLHQALDRV
ncbi:MAG: aminotransferase class I/II-fold pyridoxal phosphate-dependent enzyme [Rhodospirillaceae bacterium]|jgi:methionine-gamma-lyase|nr:aminotransferase class I/II-fold pyridoxal phosphate-dependent enzyme [Rhodospirillaceae bacterium]MBT6139762.1 aminotransferase class I/II-fold pyridoxal phosphate-dependent enzyme [Rhodospirillaceae bacterium]